MAPVSDLEALGTLGDPIRRALYDLVAGASDAVSRDEASEAAGVSRQVAAYHLDRLVDEGLLEVEYRRLTGREGPGAGRPSKLYRRSPRVLEVSLPARRYELAARILLDAAAAGPLDRSVLREVAHRTGAELGERGLDEAMAATGYEPAEIEGEVRFRNCPFHALRDRDRETTCALNLALVEGMVEGASSDLFPVLAPEEGYCCVRLKRATTE